MINNPENQTIPKLTTLFHNHVVFKSMFSYTINTQITCLMKHLTFETQHVCICTRGSHHDN